MSWKVELRKNCKTCKQPITETRFRTFCSTKCREYDQNRRPAIRAYHLKYQQEKYDKAHSKPSKNKIKCLVCGRWYIQICTHTLQRHQMNAREYKQYCDLDVKKGLVPTWYHNKKSIITKENGTIENLKAGKKFWFRKGQPGVGRFHRSQQTLERLKELHKHRTNF